MISHVHVQKAPSWVTHKNLQSNQEYNTKLCENEDVNAQYFENTYDFKDMNGRRVEQVAAARSVNTKWWRGNTDD